MSSLASIWPGFLQDWTTATQTLKAHYRELTLESLHAETLLDKLKCFYHHLLTVNTHTNLTRLTGARDFLYNQVWDAALICAFTPEQSRVADVGCGGGFPLIPMGLIRPDTQLTGIEATRKKCEFIQSAIDLPELALSGRINVLNLRAEQAGHLPDCRSQFDIVTAKAVAGLPLLLELCIPLCKTNAQFIALKGPKAVEELDSAQKALHLLHVKLKRKVSVSIPAEVQDLQQPAESVEPGTALRVARKTVVLVLEKKADTPKTFPREAPAKNPLA
jgi:16S rRNA (guanine527-N7)-methyltransferase